MKRDFVILASASPRRRELLEQLGIDYVARPADIDEGAAPGESPAVYVDRLAAAKADRVWHAEGSQAEGPVLAADTAVVLDETILGKPRDRTDALAMLAALSGRTHSVLTAVAVRFGTEEGRALAQSEVRFRATTAAERAAYCDTGEPFDKAGAYAIQGLGAVFVECISGSHSAVVGLPLFETAALLARFGMPSWLGAEQTDR
jgi:septum formation protein